MNFEEELARALPVDLPQREQLIIKGAQHLSLIAAANEYMNLTRITDAREAAIKHVCDSVLPWQHFAGAKRVLDAGTGAGFPGIPLSIIHPNVRFTLVESIGKKARFVDNAVESLHLPNVSVQPERAEAIALVEKPDIITARAVAPLSRILELFGKALRNGTRLLLYKGPDVSSEMEGARTQGIRMHVLCRYELPEQMGSRSLVEVKRER